DRARYPLPCLLLSHESPAAAGGERVVACAAIVLGRLPRRADEPLSLETIECWIQRPLVELEDVPRALLNALRDAPAMQGPELQRLENEHVERALKEVPAFLISHGSFFHRQSKGTMDSLLSSVKGSDAVPPSGRVASGPRAFTRLIMSTSSAFTRPRFRLAKAYLAAMRVLASYGWLRLWRPLLGPDAYAR